MEIRKSDNKILTVSEVASAVEEIAPAALQESWDNSGLLIGFKDAEVRKILTCLEINDKVLAEAKTLGIDMIITHHPLIFGGVKSLCDGDYKGNLIMQIVKSGISVYSCHTSFDKVKGGNNDIIAEKLGLSSIKNLCNDDVEAPSKMVAKSDEADIGRIGKLKKAMTFKEVIDLVSSELEASLRSLNIVGDLAAEITNIGICTGAGADLMEMAAASGCQLFITGDVKYHQAHTALELGICMLDAGHYGTEKFFGQAMAEMLTKKLGNKAEILVSEVDLNPFTMV